MFDDPKKALKRLEERLLAAEEPDFAEPERDEDPEAALAEVKQILDRDDWEKEHRQPLSQSYVARKHLEQLREEEETAEKIRRVKTNRTGGLVVALMLELAALMAVIAWWTLWR